MQAKIELHFDPSPQFAQIRTGRNKNSAKELSQVSAFLRYADRRDWAQPLPLGEPLEMVTAADDVISTLIRYLAIE